MNNKIKILIFDDRYGARENLCDELIDNFEEKVELTTCKDVFEADCAIDEDVFDVIIVDSMISTLGLDKEQIKYAKQGLLTGVVWLCGLHKNKPMKLQNTLLYVFSGYLDDCEDTIDTLNEYTSSDNFIKNSITFISKAGDNIDQIISGIREKFKI